MLHMTTTQADALGLPLDCHCEEQSDEAISENAGRYWALEGTPQIKDEVKFRYAR